MTKQVQHHPSYLRVFLTFARNSLVRDMTFRSNFVIEMISSMSWMFMNLGFYILIFSYVDSIGAHTGWGRYQFFVFFATTALTNSLVQSFFMPNAEEFSELIRTGNLDFALLKPIDTQFLVSLHKVHWSGLGNTGFAIGLLAYSLYQLIAGEGLQLTAVQFLLYPLYVGCGVLVLYSLMIGLAASSVWLGRNQSLYNFWFYITNFSRYPMEIFDGPPGYARRWVGRSLRGFFAFVIPVLLAVNIPARMLAKPLDQNNWPLAAFALLATAASLWVSRRIFYWALKSYRSASS
ncbi:MAG: ABC transporter permease [Planctomycetales bacterium]|nr:ABC transporter permease [Planctomycetales bacterium]NIM07612.1 ABC transporter permease [Planctomycetales bacterium]NIN07118.1 ABC transporter permease [Planctomycetales bacterium]NIN76212.1 ABC transporter permease [Planctomycetales bacterium]NIO33434.1 ABC transporter permease [Planctomycetales bacterium]